MSHLVILPILLPLLTAIVLVPIGDKGLLAQRVISLVSTLTLLALAMALGYQAAAGAHIVYAVGDWPAPFGIILVMDRLGALMLLLTGVIALVSLLAALRGTDARARYFHPLFHLQLMGLNGAFLTGDLFNLFVFFEVLLIASYGLLVYGDGTARLRAAIHYVVLNLVGSALFLIAVGVLYGITGTLNMADLALKVRAVGAGEVVWVQAGALLLLVVFGVKAAALPLYFWLPRAYAAATAPVAALFAIMTKVGIYSILRVYPLIFGAQAGPVADVAAPWLLPAALATLAMGTLGVLASPGLREMAAYLLLASIGTLLIGVGLFSEAGFTAAIYYMVHSTVIVTALFLLVDAIAAQRGAVGDRLEAGTPLMQRGLLGAMFFAAGVAIVGMPPLSGFIGKVLVLQAAPLMGGGYGVWAVVLTTSLLMLIGVSRAGSLVFWKTTGAAVAASPAGILPLVLALAVIAALTIFAAPLGAAAQAMAQQLLSPQDYITSVFTQVGVRP
jgi:multicomponent K+:H+ antiporter subunit D